MANGELLLDIFLIIILDEIIIFVLTKYLFTIGVRGFSYYKEARLLWRPQSTRCNRVTQKKSSLLLPLCGPAVTLQLGWRQDTHCPTAGHHVTRLRDLGFSISYPSRPKAWDDCKEPWDCVCLILTVQLLMAACDAWTQGHHLIVTYQTLSGKLQHLLLHGRLVVVSHCLLQQTHRQRIWFSTETTGRILHLLNPDSSLTNLVSILFLRFDFKILCT